MIKALQFHLGQIPHLFLNGLQSALVYRWSYALRCLFNGVSLLVSFIIWSAVFRDQEQVGAYTLSSILTYYVILILVEAATTPVDDDFKIAGEIRNGTLNHILLKPIHYGLYRFCLFLAGRIAFLLAAIIPFLLIVGILHSTSGVSLSNVQLWPGILTVIGSACLQFNITFCLSLLAFWLLDVSAPIFIVVSFEFLAGGHVFPLDLLPKPLYVVSQMLPFAYEYYFPVMVLKGSITGAEMWTGFCIQIAWTLFFAIAGSMIWKRGLKKYTAVGG